MSMLGRALILSLAALCAAAAADDKPLDVRDLMTASQFHKTGLDKLTPEELTAFNAWLAVYGHAETAPAPVAPPATSRTAPAAVTRNDASFGAASLPTSERGEPDHIETHIVGTFKGWYGNTVFKLENGQVWEQSGAGYFEAHLENPQVVIKKLAFGYLLTLPGQGATVFVRRLH